jgi:hypothetical protein
MGRWNFYVPETHIMYFKWRCWFLKCSEEGLFGGEGGCELLVHNAIHYVPIGDGWREVWLERSTGTYRVFYDISYILNFIYFECFILFRIPYENGPNFAKLYEIFLCKSIQNSAVCFTHNQLRRQNKALLICRVSVCGLIFSPAAKISWDDLATMFTGAGRRYRRRGGGNVAGIIYTKYNIQ